MDLPTVDTARTKIRTFLTHIFTGPDNSTFAIDRVIWGLTTIYALAVQGLDVFVNHVVFDLTKFATGMGILFTTGAVGVAAKNAAEPPGPPKK